MRDCLGGGSTAERPRRRALNATERFKSPPRKEPAVALGLHDSCGADTAMPRGMRLGTPCLSQPLLPAKLPCLIRSAAVAEATREGTLVEVARLGGGRRRGRCFFRVSFRCPLSPYGRALAGRRSERRQGVGSACTLRKAYEYTGK